MPPCSNVTTLLHFSKSPNTRVTSQRLFERGAARDRGGLCQVNLVFLLNSTAGLWTRDAQGGAATPAFHPCPSMFVITSCETSLGWTDIVLPALSTAPSPGRCWLSVTKELKTLPLFHEASQVSQQEEILSRQSGRGFC